jgi:hypothetical protein
VATSTSKAGYFEFVARFTSAGMLDSTFAKSGWRKLNIPIETEDCYANVICTYGVKVRSGNSPYEVPIGGVTVQGDRVLGGGTRGRPADRPHRVGPGTARRC